MVFNDLATSDTAYVFNGTVSDLQAIDKILDMLVLKGNWIKVI